MEKKVYETPVVTKVQFDAGDRITASVCGQIMSPIESGCNFEF